MYDIENIVIAKSVPEALAALAADEKAIVIAGGSDVLIKIREGKLAGCSLVSIHGIPALKGVTMEADGTIAIGPGNTFSEVTEHPLIRQYLPALGEAVDQAGGPQLRNIGTITGNAAMALGLVSAAHRAGLPLVLGSYPITPASDILHTLSGMKRYGVTTLQAEDEIAAVGMALGASFGGALGVTSTSGPGLALKAETIGLGVSTELPLVILDIQRGGPSTGLPTKTEQSDLLQAIHGRNGESPVAVIAPQSPSDCFDIAMEAVRIATTYRTPVIVLSDGYLANGSEPWRVPSVEDLPHLDVEFATGPNDTDADGNPVFHPFLRDPETLARPWAVPGTAGLEHRIGGIEKADVTGHISYDPDNHDKMTRLRQGKIDRIADTIPDLEVDDPSGEARVLVLGWGSTYGPIAAAARLVRATGLPVAQAHLRHLSPFPANLGEVLRAYDRVIVPEMNLGQLALLLRGQFLVDVQSHTAVRGLPFPAADLAEVLHKAIAQTLEGVQ